MARIGKPGLSYFNLDVHFFECLPLQFVDARFGHKGELIAIKLVCKIFKQQGYFIKWDDDMAILFADAAGKNLTHCLVNDVVDELLKRDFFDKGMYTRYGILTSADIQKNYTKACREAGRRRSIKDEYVINP